MRRQPFLPTLGPSSPLASPSLAVSARQQKRTWTGIESEELFRLIWMRYGQLGEAEIWKLGPPVEWRTTRGRKPEPKVMGKAPPDYGGLLRGGLSFLADLKVLRERASYRHDPNALHQVQRLAAHDGLKGMAAILVLEPDAEVLWVIGPGHFPSILQGNPVHLCDRKLGKIAKHHVPYVARTHDPKRPPYDILPAMSKLYNIRHPGGE